jgi:hypothetical protein
MKPLLYILIAALSFSCTSKLSRAKRHINRAKVLAPELVVNDTITIHDTIVIERFNYDTVTSIEYHDSTIIVNNDRVYARYFYDTLRQEIHHEIECKEIIKPIETKTVVERMREPTFMEILSSEWKHYSILLLIIAAVIFFLKK